MYARSPEVSYQLPKHIYIQSSYRITPKKLQHTHTHTIVRMLSHGALMTFYAISQANYALETYQHRKPPSICQPNQTQINKTKPKTQITRLPTAETHWNLFLCYQLGLE